MKYFFIFVFLNFSFLSFSLADSLTSSVTASKASSKISAERSQIEDDLQTNLQIKEAQKAVWQVVHDERFATAFSIGHNLFITNFHVLLPVFKKSSKNVILKQGGCSSFLQIKQVIAISALYDLALFETEEKVTDYLTIRDHPLQPDETLFVVGYPQGILMEFRNTEKLFDKAYSYYSYTFPVNQFPLEGSSGSPVLDEWGQVVGVASNGTSELANPEQRPIYLNAIKTKCLNGLIKRNLGSIYSDFYSQKCIAEEIKNMEKLSEQGHAAAQLLLMRFFAILPGKNRDVIFKMMERSFKQGNVAVKEFVEWQRKIKSYTEAAYCPYKKVEIIIDPEH